MSENLIYGSECAKSVCDLSKIFRNTGSIPQNFCLRLDSIFHILPRKQVSRHALAIIRPLLDSIYFCSMSFSLRGIFFFFTLLFFGVGCVSTSESPTSESFPIPAVLAHWQKALLMSNDSSTNVFFSDTEQNIDITHSLPPFVLLSFFPSRERFISVQKNASTQAYSFFSYDILPADAGVFLESRLLFSTRNKPVFIATAPFGDRFLLLFDDSQKNNASSACCRLAVYSATDGVLTDIAEGIASAAWLSDGKTILYNQFSVGDFSGGKLFSYDLDVPSSSRVPVLLSQHADAFVISGAKIFLADRAAEDILLLEYTLNDRTEHSLRRFVFPSSSAAPIWFDPSPDNTNALLLGWRDDQITTALFVYDNPLLSRLILPESKFVLWYTDNEIFFQTSSPSSETPSILSIDERTSRPLPFSSLQTVFSAATDFTSPVSSLFLSFLPL